MYNHSVGKPAIYASLHERRASTHLDMIRGAAAIAVLMYHVRYRFFYDYADLSDVGLVAKLFYIVTSFGHDAVMVFFVLSGYFISASVIRDRNSNRWSWRRYAINRSTRLYAVLLPGILLTLFWDHLGLTLFPYHPVYTGDARPWMHDFFSVSDRINPRTLAANAAFLQMVIAPPLGSNASLWSLSYEFWYYLLFPLGWIAIASPSFLRSTAYAGLFVGILLFLGKGIATYFPIWLMGTAVCLLPKHRLLTGARVWPAAAVAGTFFFGALLVAHTSALRPLVGNSVIRCDYLTGFTFAIVLYVLLHQTSAEKDDLYARCAKAMAGFSYTLYVVHLPLLVFLRAYLAPDEPWIPDREHLGIWGLLVAACLAYAALIYRFTEKRTDSIRRRLFAALGASSTR